MKKNLLFWTGAIVGGLVWNGGMDMLLFRATLGASSVYDPLLLGAYSITLLLWLALMGCVALDLPKKPHIQPIVSTSLSLPENEVAPSCAIPLPLPSTRREPDAVRIILAICEGIERACDAAEAELAQEQHTQKEVKHADTEY